MILSQSTSLIVFWENDDGVSTFFQYKLFILEGKAAVLKIADDL